MSLLDTMVGEYRVLRLLGQGGMGEVYEATHPIIGKRVAVKVLKRELSEDSSLALRFIEEARAINAIRHHSIVDVFGFGTLPDGQLYLVMDLLEGESFSAYLKANAPLDPPEAMRWLIELLDAIAAAHEAGVVHRDLKPSNLFLVGPRGKRLLKVLDFGIARRLTRDERLTRPNMLLGSPSYVSPEQIRGEAHFASDLYAIGCMAWAMLTGRTLFKGEVLDVLNMHLFEKPAPPSTLAPGISPELDAFVLKLLEKEEKDRPVSAAVARDELRVIVHATRSSPTRPDHEVLREERAPEKALTSEEPAPTQLHRPEVTVIERRVVTETAPSLVRPDTAAVSTGTAPELVVPPRRIHGPVIALAALLVLGVGVFVATRPEPVVAPPPPAAAEVVATPSPAVAVAPPAATPEVVVPPPAPSAEVAPPPVAEPRAPAPLKAAITPPRKLEPAPRPRPVQLEELPTRDRPATAPSWSVLDARLKKDEAILSAGGARGGATAAQFLADARERLSPSTSAADRVALESFLDDWERRYLPPR